MKPRIDFFKPEDFPLSVLRCGQWQQTTTSEIFADLANRKLENESNIVYGQINEKGNWLNHDWFNASHTGFIIGIKENPNYINTKSKGIVDSVLMYFDIKANEEQRKKAAIYIKTHFLEKK